jgi:hypothetical protein
MKKKLKHEKMCNNKKRIGDDPKESKVTKYYRIEQHSEFQKKIKNFQTKKKQKNFKESFFQKVENEVQEVYNKNSRYFMINHSSPKLSIFFEFSSESMKLDFRCLNSKPMKNTEIRIEENYDTKKVLDILDEFYFVADIYFENNHNLDEVFKFQKFWNYVKSKPNKLFSTEQNTNSRIFSKS